MKADLRSRRFVAIGGGFMSTASKEERAVERLHADAGRRVTNYNVYLVVNKNAKPIEVTMTPEGLMGWTSGASRTLVRKVRSGNMCYIGGWE